LEKHGGNIPNLLRAENPENRMGQYSKSFDARLRIQKTLLSRPANAWARIKWAVEVPRKAKG